MKKETAEFVLKRCGRLAANLPEAVAASAVGNARGRRRDRRADSAASERSPDAADAAETPEEPEDTTPLGALRKIGARIDEELIALEALKLPKFLRIDVFVWPFLLLAVGLIAGLGLGTGVGWTAGRDRGAGRRPGRRDRGLYRTCEDGSPQRGAPRRAVAEGDRRGRPTGRTEQGLGQKRIRKQASRARQKP